MEVFDKENTEFYYIYNKNKIDILQNFIYEELTLLVPLI